MKGVLRHVLWYALFACSVNFAAVKKEVVVVTASYNNSLWYKKNLDSILSQDYENFRVIYTDDASFDGTGDLVEQYLEEHPQGHKVTLIKNEKRRGALANQFNAIYSCDDRTIIVIVDGDDFLPDNGVLSYVVSVYDESDVWLTYGQFREWPRGRVGFCRPMPRHIVQGNLFRTYSGIPSHMRTFYAGLFKSIEREDLIYQGDFFKMSGDIAAMFPMIEMARDGHFRFISRVLYTYNASNPINDHKIDKPLQRRLDLIIRSRRRYDALEFLFEG